MSQYVQLLGTDVPDSFGGCCYYGPVEHSSLQPPPPLPSTAVARTTSSSFGVRTAEAWASVAAQLADSSGRATAATATASHTSASASSGGSGSDGCLLFNCPEGTQRFSSEAGLRLTKVKGFFFTRWGGAAAAQPPHPAPRLGAGTAVMGLPGLLFTVNDAGVTHANFFGPSSSLRAARMVQAMHIASRAGGPAEAAAEAAAASVRLGGADGHWRRCAGGGADTLDAAPARGSGMEGFLHALRRGYFLHRKMTFRQLAPVPLPQALAPPLPPPPHRAQAEHGRAGAGEGDDGADTDACATDSHVPPCASQDESFPLVLLRAPDDEDDGFIKAVIPLSRSSALVAFRVSAVPTESPAEGAGDRTHTKGAAQPPRELLLESSDTSDEVFGYAIVAAPAPTFDAQRARQLGVRPGPKYAQLKQGVPVLADVNEDEGTSRGSAPGPINRSDSSNNGSGRRAARRRQSHADAPGNAAPAPLEEQEAGRSDPAYKRRRCPASADSNEECDDADALPGSQTTERVGSPAPRLIHPRDVMRSTPTSRQLFVTLVLDGDCAGDVRGALNALLCPPPGSAILTSGGGSGGAECTREGDGRLLRALRAHCPELLVYDDDGDGNAVDEGSDRQPCAVERGATGSAVHSADGSAAPAEVASAHSGLAEGGSHHSGSTLAPCSTRSRTRRRAVVLQQVMHLQPGSYFAPFARAAEAASARYDRYVKFVFGDVLRHAAERGAHASSSALTEEEKSSYPTALSLSLTTAVDFSAATADRAPTASSTTLHVFSAYVQERFTAFPTALVHRHHLHRIAPSCFPGLDAPHADGASVETDGRGVTAATGRPSPVEEEGVDGAAQQPSAGVVYWPYSLRFCCVPSEKVSAAPPSANSSGAAKPQQKQQRRPTEGLRLCPLLSRHVLPEAAAAPCLRYPTAAVAESMLSSNFRASLRGGGGVADPAREKRVLTSLSGWADADGGGALAFTGTGSAVPSKYRNVSGTLLEVHAPPYCYGRDVHAQSSEQSAPGSWTRGVFVLDFGEGSAGQLRAFFRSDEQQQDEDALPECGDTYTGARSPGDRGGEHDGPLGSSPLHQQAASLPRALVAYLLDLEMVFISHGHADHHLGLLSLLSLRHACIAAEAALAEPFPMGRSCTPTDWRAAPQSSTTPGARPARQRQPLVVVLPAEVYEFMQLTWLATAPYCDWANVECSFDVLPSQPRFLAPAAVAATDASTSAATTDGDTAATAELVRGARVNPPSRAERSAWLPHATQRLHEWNQRILAVHSGSDDSETARRPDARARAAQYWDVDVFPVDHPANAHGVLLRFPASSRSHQLASRVLLFSGDTRPSDVLVQCCNDFCQRAADGARDVPFVCLHEATFGPGYEVEAERKSHSTLPEAMRVAARTASSFVVVNHFSQRYPKLPGLTAEQLGGSTVDLHCKTSGARASAATPRVAEPAPHAESAELSPSSSRNLCFAFDLMRLPFSAIEDGSVARLLPTFVRLLEEYEEWGTGTTQRLRE